VVLIHRARSFLATEWRSIKQRVPITWTKWLVYASQQQAPMFRNLCQSQKIRKRLGGSPDPFEPFPKKPRGVHRRTYLRLRARAEAAEVISFGRR
jgi:hypothetical protein